MAIVVQLDERRERRINIHEAPVGPVPLACRQSVSETYRSARSAMYKLLILLLATLAVSWGLQWLDRGEFSLLPLVIFVICFFFGFLPEHLSYRRTRANRIDAYVNELRDYVTFIGGNAWYAMPEILIPNFRSDGPAGYIELEKGRVDLWILPDNSYRCLCRRRSADGSVEPARLARIGTNFNAVVSMFN